jgi:hypothetical protein
MICPVSEIEDFLIQRIAAPQAALARFGAHS